MAVTFAKGVLIVLNFIAFVVKIAFNGQANTISKVFPKRTGEVSKENETDLTPATATFAIWGIIYLLQLCWIMYTLSLIIRPQAPDILPTSFYVIYTLSCILNASWLVAWAHEKMALSFVLLVSITLALITCSALAHYSLYKYVIDTQMLKRAINEADVWCIKNFVLNGVMFYTTWVCIASCINLATFLQSDVGYSRSKAGSIALSTLLVILIVWFISENFIYSRYTKHTFAQYIVLAIALYGVLKRQWTDGRGNQTYVVAIFVLSLLMFGARLMIVWMKSKTENEVMDKTD